MPGLFFDTWMLGYEASSVIWLRCAQMASGAAGADKEAVRMVTEKWDAQAELATALATGRFGTDPGRIASKTVAHYRKRVRANQARLTR